MIMPGERKIKDSIKYDGYLMIFMICICFVAGHGVSARDNPRAVIESSSWDFGFIPQKSIADHRFYLYNAGSAPLSVLEVEVDCPCVSVSEIETPVAPHDSACIIVTFNSGRYHGQVVKTAVIHTNDPEMPVHRLRVTANVYKKGETLGDVGVSPPKFIWNVSKGEITLETDTLRITNKGVYRLSTAVLHFPQEIIDRVELPSSITPGNSGNICLVTSGKNISEDIVGLSATVILTGRDTIIVTVPIEIKKAN